jgi:hypothetical protein
METTNKSFVVDLGAMVAFNTKRGYTDMGQRIAAVVLPDGRVMFADIDRNIDGVTNEPYDAERAEWQTLREFVLAEYDHGRISYGAFGAWGEKNVHQEAAEALLAGLKHTARFV